MFERVQRTSVVFVSATLLVIGFLGLCAVELSGCGGDTGTPKGGSGSAGSTGASGSAGSSGSAGATGSAGASGAGTSGSAGSTGSTGSAGGTAGSQTTGTGGAAGSQTAGTAGAGGDAGTAGGTGGSAPHVDGGADTKPVGGTAGATGGAKPAIATLVQANGNGFNGTATFTPDSMGFITLTLMVKNCGNGAHGIHLGMMPDCGNDGINSGMHWTPKGDGIGDVTCAGGGGGMGMATYKTPSAGYWTIGTGDPTSDILMRSLVVDQGPTAMPKTPMGCGVPRTD